MDAIRRESSWLWNARSERIFLRRTAEARLMATTIANSASTQEKLLRARDAAAKLALLSTTEKNALLLSIADAIEAQAPTILAANLEDVEGSGLEGAMRDRLLLTTTRIEEMAQGVRDV